MLFFFCIAPILQYKDGFAMLGTTFSIKSYRLTSLYVIFICIFYNIIYRFISNRYKIIEHEYSFQIENNSYINSSKSVGLIIISFCIFLYYLYYNNFNLLSLLFRGGEYVDRVRVSQITFLITSYFLRPITMIVFVVAYQLHAKKVHLWILGLLFLLSCPPTGMARFSAAVLYIPVLLYMLPFMRKTNMFVLILTVGLLVIFPLLGSTRNYTPGNFSFNINFEQFESLNFDSFSMFMRVLQDDIVTNGYQLLGVILFWVPRSIWPNKPIGSGGYIAHSQDLVFDNISMPYFGEGYINFGILGVVLFLFFISWFSAKEDNKYWEYTSKHADNVDKIRYFLLLGLLMFILRGDLLSSFAYTCGFIYAFKFIKYVIIK